MPPRLKQFSVLPGFGITLGYTTFYLSLIVLIPLAALWFKAFSDGPSHFWNVVKDEQVVDALKLSFTASLLAAFINAIFGFIIAWSLTRYEFFGRKILDAIVDMPFALPTAVSGIALVSLYGANGPIGSILIKMGFKSPVYNFYGITLALTFIGLPFVVRTLQPAIDELDGEVEEAAASLGANRWKTFWRVLFPSLVPALLTGFALSFARALGEYGSVIFIAGNIPYKTEIAPLLIYKKLEAFDYAGATAIAVVMLVASFAIMFAINILQWWASHRHR